jgi:hypothetical protein
MTSRWTACLAAGLTLVAAQLSAQVVQQPSYRTTTMGSTIVVPDQGATFLGGINRSSMGRNEFGVPGLGKLPFVNRLFNNRSIGQDMNSGNVWVTAKIHDFDAMEEALLGTTPDLFAQSHRRAEPAAGLAGRAPQPRNPNLEGNWQPKPAQAADGRAPLNLADEQTRRAAQQKTRADEATDFFERGRQAEADGKANVAKIFYQMAARRATGDLKQQALAKLEAIGSTQAAGKMAQTGP